MSSESPRVVSVIVPAHNYAHYLPEMMQSLQAQTLAEWECVIIDDGSTDDTRAVVEKLASADARIRYFHQDSQGPSAARNAGFEKSRGRYLQLLDADDLLEPGKLKLHADYLDAHPEVGLVYGEIRYFRNEHPRERTLSLDGGAHPWTSEISAQGEPLLHAVVTANITAINAPLFRKDLALAADGFDAARRYAEDWDFWIRLALAGGRFHFLHAEGARALGRSHGVSRGHDRVRMLEANITLRRALQPRLLTEELKALNTRQLDDAAFLLALEKTLESRTLWRRWRRALRIGAQSRNSRRILYALAFPFARETGLQSVVRLVQTLRFRGRAHRS